jgi:thiamine biosynthesis protein ThiS
MTIVINGESREVPAPVSLEGLIDLLGLRGDRVAVELNHEIVRKDRWAAVQLRDRDRLEIVHFVGGG